MSNSKKFMPTFILISINVGFYIYTSVIGGSFLNTSIDMIFRFGQVGELVIYHGYYYQILTSMFAHANIAHLFGNMLFLFVFGLRAEEFFSLSEYFFIYFIGGLTGNLLSLVLLPLNIPSLGASGAVFAIFGSITIYARKSIRQSIVGALIYALFLLFLSSGPNVNNFAHIGGLFVGLTIGYVIASAQIKKQK